MKKNTALTAGLVISLVTISLQADEKVQASTAAKAAAPKTVAQVVGDAHLKLDATIGVIDSFAVMGDSIPGKIEREDIEAKQANARVEIQDEMKIYEKAKNEYASKATMMTDAARAKEVKKLDKMETDLSNMAQEKGEELKQEMQAATEKLSAELDMTIAELAKIEDLDLVVDKMTGRVLYVSDKFDFTDKAVDKMNKRHEIKLAENKKAVEEKSLAIAENKTASKPAKSNA